MVIFIIFVSERMAAVYRGKNKYFIDCEPRLIIMRLIKLKQQCDNNRFSLRSDSNSCKPPTFYLDKCT